jgi:hypothetical protein
MGVQIKPGTHQEAKINYRRCPADRMAGLVLRLNLSLNQRQPETRLPRRCESRFFSLETPLFEMYRINRHHEANLETPPERDTDLS